MKIHHTDTFTIWLATFIVCLIVGMCSCSKESTSISHHQNRVDTITQYLQEGDIVFRRGEGIISRAVIAGDVGGYYSHIGLAIRRNDTLMIAHAVPGEHDTPNDFDRVKIDEITNFFQQKYAINGAIMRLELTSEQKHKLSETAIDKAHRKVKFDHNYDTDDTTRLYCTEFIQLLFDKIGIDISQGRRSSIILPGLNNNIIMPSDIHQNTNLKQIYYY